MRSAGVVGRRTRADAEGVREGGLATTSRLSPRIGFDGVNRHRTLFYRPRRTRGGSLWLTAISVVLLSTLACVSYAKIDAKNVAGAWMLDENKGDKANDTSGNNNHGTLQGNVKWVAGKYGSAAAFDGTSWIQVPSSASLNMEKEVTVMFFVKTNKKMVDMWADRQAVVGKHYLEYEVGIYMNGQLHTYTSDGAGNYDEGIMTTINGKHPDGDADWVKDKWYHVAWTLKGAHEIAYVDGVLLGEHDKAHANTKPGAHPVEFGRRVGGGIPVSGAVDEVCILNVAASADDIKLAAQKGIGAALGITAVDPSGKVATTWASVKR